MAVVTDGILWTSESTLAKVVGVPRSTYQTWDAEGLVDAPESGAFLKLHLVEALICKVARQELSVNATRNGMQRLRSGGLEQVVDLVRDPKKAEFVDLVVAKDDSSFEVCLSNRELARAVHPEQGTQGYVVTRLGDLLARAIGAFENEANRGAPPAARRRGRPRKSERGSVIPLRSG